MIFNFILKNGKSLPMFISENELLQNEIIQYDDILNLVASWGHDVENVHFVEKKADEKIDFREVEIDKEVLKEYVLEKTGQEIESFSFPEVGSYQYLLAAIGQKQTSPNLYIKNIEIELKESSVYDMYDYDPYSDDPDPCEDPNDYDY